MTTMLVQVSGMTCEHCKAAIERSVGALPAVRQVTADFSTNRVEVEWDGTPDEPAMRAAIEDEGYDVVAVGPED